MLEIFDFYIGERLDVDAALKFRYAWMPKCACKRLRCGYLDCPKQKGHLRDKNVSGKPGYFAAHKDGKAWIKQINRARGKAEVRSTDINRCLELSVVIDAEQDGDLIPYGRCSNCGHRGIRGNYCSKCEDMGMIYEQGSDTALMFHDADSPTLSEVSTSSENDVSESSNSTFVAQGWTKPVTRCRGTARAFRRFILSMSLFLGKPKRCMSHLTELLLTRLSQKTVVLIFSTFLRGLKLSP